MKRKLITQMRAEWRSNLWMIIELIIVLFILQFIFSILFLFVDLYGHKGYDVSDLHVASVKTISKDSPDYVPYDDDNSYVTDFNIILSRLKNNPNVESAAKAGGNSLPYDYNYWGNSLTYKAADSTYVYNGNMRAMSPELLRIMRIEGPDRTTEQLAEVLERGEFIITDCDEDYAWGELADPEILLGNDVYLGYDTAHVRHVGAIAYGMRRSDFEPLGSGVIYHNFDTGDDFSYIVVRVKPGHDNRFLESLTPADMEQGNVYITDFVSIDSMRERAHLQYTQIIRDASICAAFLLLVIFLGFLGAFWFRTQQRVSEIAVRMVNGATKWQIFSRFISEGLVMLAVAMVVVLPLFWALIESGVLDSLQIGSVPDRVLIQGVVASVVAVALLIIGGIWAPARKAMKINPAQALKDQ